MTLPAPQLLSASHDVSAFDCGYPALDLWLQHKALANQERRASRTYVVVEGRSVRAYYSLAAGSIEHADAISRLRRNMPNPIPMALLGRLAVDRRIQGKGFGHGLLKDALQRMIQAADFLAIRGVVVDAIDDPAKAFYERFGFRPSPAMPLKLMITLEDAERALKEARQE